MKAYFKSALKKKASIVFLSVAALLLCLGIIKLVKPLNEYFYEGSHTFAQGVAVEEYVVYTGISLPPGVYKVELEYATDMPLGFLCKAQDGTVFPGALLTNGENLYAGCDRTGYLMWLYESTDALEITISSEGEYPLTTGNLTIRETRLMGSLMVAVTLFIVAGFFGVLAYRGYERVYGIAVEQKKAILGVVVIALIASVPYLLGVLFTSADLGYHLHRIEGIRDGFLSGQFPVRIEPEWVHGHGYASGVFYCSTLLVFPGILRMIGFTVTDSYCAYAIALNLLTAWVAYHCFAKIFKDRTIGLACSALYTLSAIRIYKHLLTAAVGEAAAMTFLPLVFCGFYLVFAEEIQSKDFKRAWLYLGFGYAGLLQTHVLTCEITAFLTIVLCVIMLKRVFQKQRFWMLAKGALSAVGLSFWFLIPFLDYYINEDMHIKYVSGRTIQNRGLFPAQLIFHWFSPGNNAMMGMEGMRDADPMGLGLVLFLAFAVFVALWFAGSWRQEKNSQVTAGKIAAVFGGALMVMSLNIFPWDKIQNLNSVTASLVSSLQFPNRFLGWASAFCVVLAGCCMWYFKKNGRRWGYYVALVVTLCGITTSSMYFINVSMQETETFQVYNVEGMGRGYISGAEYLIEGTDASKLLYGAPIVSDNVEVTAYEKGSLRAGVSCTNHSSGSGYVDLPLLLYRGYRAVDADTGEALDVGYGENYTVCVTIPAGYSGTFEVRYEVPWYWRLSEVVTLLSCIGIGFAVVYGRRNGKKAREIHVGLDKKA